MNRITNKQIMEKLEIIQNDMSHKEIIKKLDTTLHTVQNIQNSVADKETIRKLSYQTKKSIIVIYRGLSIAYLGIGLALLLASLELIAIQYSIIFGVFFGGSIVLASLAYVRKKEL
jgi:hypothetical protein